MIVATNIDVVNAVAKGAFRKDLYYRLRTHHIELPPLRQRTGDVRLLTSAFVKKAAQALGKPQPAVPPALFQLLQTYSFPGNVRELEAMVFDAVARHDGPVLSLQSFRALVLPDAHAGDGIPRSDASNTGGELRRDVDPLPTLHEAEQQLMAEALRRAGGNQGVAAGMLGISRQALNKRLAQQRRPLQEGRAKVGPVR